MRLWSLDVEVPADTPEQAVKELLGILLNASPEELEDEGWLCSVDADYLDNTTEDEE